MKSRCEFSLDRYKFRSRLSAQHARGHAWTRVECCDKTVQVNTVSSVWWHTERDDGARNKKRISYRIINLIDTTKHVYKHHRIRNLIQYTNYISVRSENTIYLEGGWKTKVAPKKCLQTSPRKNFEKYKSCWETVWIFRIGVNLQKTNLPRSVMRFPVIPPNVISLRIHEFFCNHGLRDPFIWWTSRLKNGLHLLTSWWSVWNQFTK